MDLEAKRAAALKDNRCFSKTTLKVEYRMKPGANAQPVKFYKNGFGLSYGVYLISDCVPMRPLVKRSDKQKENDKKLGEIARKSSRRYQALLMAHDLMMMDNVVVLDTETTGLESDDQIIEIGVTDIKGNVLLEQRVRPSVPVNPEASNVHAICDVELEHEPCFLEIEPQLKQLLTGKTVVIFNAEFDIRLLNQTANAFGCDSAWIAAIKTECAMYLAADILGPTNRYGTISLSDTLYSLGVNFKHQAHSAIGDAIATAKIINEFSALHCHEYKQSNTI
ncbi:3'-5' exonuclease [Photobacterium leiognathi]|uniref:3'-5' exonuclease n=1 Tax=Photobacterium leiognathi TaxID=553611 RepID=UPI002981CA12|nr:3'-5' exonuclease [Photobacterium leiognathi]